MLYTSYISNMRNLPEGRIILITRWAPKSLDLSKFENATWEPILAPADSLLASYKNGIMTKTEMLSKYKEYLNNSLAVNELCYSLAEDIKEGKNVFLICYEKAACDCHRSVLAQFISDKFSVQWKEYVTEEVS